MANSIKSAQFLIESRLADAAKGSAQACYELGIAYSCGTGDVDIDLIEAHKWFNLAALAGSEEGQSLRAEVAEDMTAREIAEAQRQARAWIAATGMRRAA
ncbi:MAG: SEL1-like repeat protein [Sphingobium sp.]